MKGDAEAAIMCLLNLLLANAYTGFWSAAFTVFSVGYALVYLIDLFLSSNMVTEWRKNNPSPSPSAKTAARERMNRKNRRG